MGEIDNKNIPVDILTYFNKIAVMPQYLPSFIFSKIFFMRFERKKPSLTPLHFIEVPVPTPKSGLPFICVLGVSF